MHRTKDTDLCGLELEINNSGLYSLKSFPFIFLFNTKHRKWRLHWSPIHPKNRFTSLLFTRAHTGRPTVASSGAAGSLRALGRRCSRGDAPAARPERHRGAAHFLRREWAPFLLLRSVEGGNTSSGSPQRKYSFSKAMKVELKRCSELLLKVQVRPLVSIDWNKTTEGQ